MRIYIILVIAVLTFIALHEGTHLAVGYAYGEFESLRILPYGVEVIFKTPVELRSGIQWGFISGSANVLTLSLGYLLFLIRAKIAALKSIFWVSVQ